MSLRLIFEKVETDEILGGTKRDLFTIDVELPQIEELLLSGGRGEMGSDYVRLVGVEVRTARWDEERPDLTKNRLPIEDLKEVLAYADALVVVGKVETSGLAASIDLGRRLKTIREAAGL